MATEKFSAAIFYIFYVGLFSSSREYNHLCKYYPKKFYLFVVILFISSIDISFNSLIVCNSSVFEL